MWIDCEKNSNVIWYSESQYERNSSHIVTHIVRRLWGNCERRWIPLLAAVNNFNYFYLYNLVWLHFDSIDIFAVCESCFLLLSTMNVEIWWLSAKMFSTHISIYIIYFLKIFHSKYSKGELILTVDNEQNNEP